VFCDGDLFLPNCAIVAKDLPRVPSLWGLRLDNSGRRSSSRWLSCVLAVVLADLFLIFIVAVFLTLVWLRLVIGIIIFAGGGRMAAIVLSRFLPVRSLGRLWRFIAGDRGFVNGVYAASVLRTESWHGRGMYTE
jgi:hypothetical protein